MMVTTPWGPLPLLLQKMEKKKKRRERMRKRRKRITSFLSMWKPGRKSSRGME
jgi:hypothetical protein